MGEWMSGMWGWGMMGISLLFVVAVSVLILVAIVALIRWLWVQGRVIPRAGGGEETALDILKKRYARGEMSREEFEARRRDLTT